MALVRIDWSPDAAKLRQFAAGLAVFSAILALLAYLRGHLAATAAILAAGTLLAAVTASSPRAGLWIYKAWMSVAFVIGTCVSYAALAFIYFGIVTPMALFFRLKGRDALGLKPAAGGSTWQPLSLPEDKSRYERLF